jgi:hypothetical protein
MSFQVSTAFVQDYKSTVQHLLQQKGSKLRNAVTMDTYTGKAGKAVEQVGAVAAQKRTTRHGDTPLISTPHDARWVHPTDYEWADLIDDQDKLRMIIDPTSPYAINGAYAIGRAFDESILEAALGTSLTGEDGTTSTAFDTTNQTIAHGSAGLTIAKLRNAKKILMANEVDIDNDPLFIAFTAEQHDDLLSETQAISLDYNTKPVLVDGRITSFMGFNFIHTELVTADATPSREVVAWAKSGMHLGIWNDITTRITERDDKSYANQVYVKSTHGATRLEEGKVVEILCTE